MEYIVVAVVAVTLILMVHASFEARLAGRILSVLMAAFVVRLAVNVMVTRSGLIDYGGDNLYYEAKAVEIAEYWRHYGVQFVGSEQVGPIYSISVPCHLFAIVVYLCGGRAPLACTAVVALIACGLCVVMYRFARLVGADERAAFRLLVITAFLPGFLLHTSDTFKDGLNAFLVLACLALAASNMQRFGMRKLLLLTPLLWALWHVRPYMVFMCGLPLLLGVARIRRAVSPRTLLVVAALAVPALVAIQGTGELPAAEILQEQLERGQSAQVRSANAEGGSGVVFEDGGDAWNALGPKIAYTVLAPFPWMSGSPTLQFGKVDTVLWYYLLYCAAEGFRRLWRHDRRMLLIIMLFIIPGTVAYATTMSNIGLIFRQRMPIVMVTSLLSAIAWTRTPFREDDPPAPAADAAASAVPGSRR
ncbi:hypothetical protein ACFYSC_13505 [Streptosporangium sp. NPDC004379]|uniref:hypothetical protein n=1 Tax=Streptosporangium sp. NPDC004379 TaxID=3366189 RepID=UPI00367AED7B